MSETDRIIKRESECLARRGGQCKLISDSLGFPHSVPMAECDMCYAMGGIAGGKEWRDSYVQLGVSNLKKKGLQNFPPHIGEAVVSLHSSPDEVAALTEQVELSKKKAGEPNLTVWLGREWEGIPWPKRLPMAAAAFLYTMFVQPWPITRQVWQSMSKTGCGCDNKTKNRVRKWLGRPLVHPPSPSSSPP